MQQPSSWVGVDWGTSRVRAFRFDAHGLVVETRSSDDGVGTMQGRSFINVLRTLLNGWLMPTTRLILCGMVGSRNGWTEVPYLSCPASLQAMSRAAVAVANPLAPAWIAAGLSVQRADGGDVMRGEEVQLLGANLEHGTLILPGTHSKWARIHDGAVQEFRTYMTGELFELVVKHSIVGRIMEGAAASEQAFIKGVQRAVSSAALSSLLFGARAEVLLGELAASAAHDYVSGLLIGAEVVHGLRADAVDPAALCIIASQSLAARYAQAIAALTGHTPRIIDGEQAAAHGLWRLATAIDAQR